MTRERAMEILIEKVAGIRKGKPQTFWWGMDEEALAFAITDMKICARNNMGSKNRQEKKEN